MNPPPEPFDGETADITPPEPPGLEDEEWTPPSGDRQTFPPAPAGSEVGRLWLASGLGALAGLLLIGLLAGLLLGNAHQTARASSGAAGGAAVAPGTPRIEAPAAGYLAPQFTLVDLNGQAVSLKDFRGHPVWINFWATWCPPCRAEMPEMKQFYTRYKDRGLVILGVDVAESPETVSTFVRQNGYDWTFLLDRDTQVGQRYGASGIPTHAFVDPQGVIRIYKISGLTPTLMTDYLAQLLPQ